MADDRDTAMLEDLARRIALFERGETLGDCMGPGSRMYWELSLWLAAGVVAWVILTWIACQ